MKKLLLCIGIFCLQFFSSIIVNACNCGFNAGSTQNPSFVLTPTTSWKTEPGIRGGHYTLFNVVEGNIYTWSYCSDDGGNASWDTRVNLYDNSTQICLANNSDFCQLQSRLTWTADFTGVVRLITNIYINSTTPCGTNTTNATLAYKITGVSSKPDLVIEEFPTLSSSTVSVGGNTTVNFKVKNQGNANAGSSMTSIHISSKSWYDGTATYVDEYATSSISMGSNSGSKSKSITLPSSITPGNYYILVSADGGPPYPGGAVSESNENNQTTYVAITVQSCTYSIFPTSQNFPVNGGSGSFDVNTQSACPWNATTTNSWISTSSSGSGSGDVDYTVQANPDIISRTGTIKVEGKTFTITQDAAPLLKADLSLSNISITPNPLIQGASATITCYMWNLGLADAQNVSVSYMLSNDCSGNTANDYPLGTSSTVNISSLGKYTMSFNVQIPVDALWEGTKYLKCWIDFSNNVAETNDNNNLLCTQVTINSPTGQGFELNVTSLIDSTIISHLRWPFGGSSSWANRKGFKGGSEIPYYSGKPSGHGDKGHDSGEYYADDWVNLTMDICNDSFYAPIGGNIIYVYSSCSSGCTGLLNSCGNGFGNHIVIQSIINPNFAFRVAHLKSISQEIIEKHNKNQPVEVLEFLGIIGATGKATGPHAHCALYQNIYMFDYISGTTNKEQGLTVLSVGRSVGIGSFPPFVPTIFAANFKFDAVWGGVISGGGPSATGNQYDTLLDLNVFPNPNNGEFKVDFFAKNDCEIKLRVYSMLGTELYSEAYQARRGSNSRSVKLCGLSSGVYLVFIDSEYGRAKSKIVVTK